GLEASVTNEIDRFNRLNVIEASFSSEGEKIFPPKEDTIILFRILQEFFSNVLKHSKATKLSVNFFYKKGELQITAKDNGNGFDVEKVEKSSGLFNMKKRAEIINSSFRLDSSSNGGTSLYLSYPTKIKQNEQNDHYR
ncbi:MAG: ATP-binding protein, partial [Salegentibacter sp.]